MTVRRTVILLAILLTAVFEGSVKPSAAQSPERAPEYLGLNQVWTVVQPYLLAAGERYQKPGKERITAAGNLTANQGQPTPVQVTIEYPRKVRIDQSRGSTTFDGSSPSPQVPRDPHESAILETLVEDSLDGFFHAHRTGSNHYLGSFRVRGAGEESPAYAIMEIWTKSPFRGGQQSIAKQYWFDRRTKLLSRVVYRSGPGGSVIEVFLSDWYEVEGEMIPLTIERKEAGGTTLRLQLTSVLVSPKATDGAFGAR
jgi:hypothetical protein